MLETKKYYTTFWGHEVSEYAKKHGFVDYGTLAKAFDMVLCNDITTVDLDLLENLVSGSDRHYEDEEGNIFTVEDYEDLTEEEQEESGWTEHYKDIFQWFLISYDMAQDLIYLESDIPVYHSDLLDVYVLGIDHYGTSWDYVLTDIPLEENKYED